MATMLVWNSRAMSGWGAWTVKGTVEYGSTGHRHQHTVRHGLWRMVQSRRTSGCFTGATTESAWKSRTCTLVTMPKTCATVQPLAGTARDTTASHQNWWPTFGNYARKNPREPLPTFWGYPSPPWGTLCLVNAGKSWPNPGSALLVGERWSPNPFPPRPLAILGTRTRAAPG